MSSNSYVNWLSFFFNWNTHKHKIYSIDIDTLFCTLCNSLSSLKYHSISIKIACNNKLSLENACVGWKKSLHSDWSKLMFGDETLFSLFNAFLEWYVMKSIYKNVHSLSRVLKPVSYRSFVCSIFLFFTTNIKKERYSRVIKKIESDMSVRV